MICEKKWGKTQWFLPTRCGVERDTPSQMDAIRGKAARKNITQVLWDVSGNFRHCFSQCFKSHFYLLNYCCFPARAAWSRRLRKHLDGAGGYFTFFPFFSFAASPSLMPNYIPKPTVLAGLMPRCTARHRHLPLATLNSFLWHLSLTVALVALK